MPPPPASAWKPNRKNATPCKTISATASDQLESARQQVLRLLGEASALRNQLAQADEYLAAMERDAARSRKEEEGASADIARLDQSRAELSTRLSARQLELESLTDRRRRVEEESQGPPAAHRRVRAKN